MEFLHTSAWLQMSLGASQEHTRKGSIVALQPLLLLPGPVLQAPCAANVIGLMVCCSASAWGLRADLAGCGPQLSAIHGLPHKYASTREAQALLQHLSVSYALRFPSHVAADHADTAFCLLPGVCCLLVPPACHSCLSLRLPPAPS
jgi:hypothetical protein